MYGMLIKKCPIKRNGSILQFATQISYNFSKHNSLKNWREIQNDQKKCIYTSGIPFGEQADNSRQS